MEPPDGCRYFSPVGCAFSRVWYPQTTMIDLYPAALQAARTPAQKELLAGLIDGESKFLIRTLEEYPDHSRLLEPSFFWCFMGLAAEHGDRDCWQALQGLGYGGGSEVLFPSSVEGVPKISLTLAGWLSAWLPTERLDDLQRWGVVSPRSSASYLSSHALNVAEQGLISGNAAHFDYWFPVWVAQEQAENTRRRAKHPVPSVLLGKIVEAFWDESLDPAGQAEQRRRRNLVFGILADHHFSGIEPKDWVASLAKRLPVQTLHLDRAGLWLRWALEEQKVHPSNPCLAVPPSVLKARWAEMLVNAGWPLSSKDATAPFELGRTIEQGLLEKTPEWISAGQAFLNRVGFQDPLAQQDFFAPKAASIEPWPVQLLEQGNSEAMQRLVTPGFALDLTDAKGRPFDQRVLHAVAQDPHWASVFEEWAKVAGPELARQALEQGGRLEDDDPFVETGLVSQRPFTKKPVQALIQLIESGLPMTPRQGESRGIFVGVLEAFADESRFHADLFEALTKADPEQTRSLFPGMDSPLKSLQALYQNDIGAWKAFLRQTCLKEQWEPGIQPGRKPRL